MNTAGLGLDVGPPHVAIIGAGMSGLIAARTLLDQGFRVRLFDKARGAGGRMATRRREGFQFDHGAQYFTASDPRFRKRVDGWIEDGVAAQWNGRIGVSDQDGIRVKDDGPDRFVGTPRMSAITRHLSADLDIEFETAVTGASFDADGGWVLRSDSRDLGAFDALIVTIPPEQAAHLLDDVPLLKSVAATARMQPCWALMAVFDRAVETEFDGLFINTGPLSWAARNNSKPGRPGDETWVMHASAPWSTANLEKDPDTVAEELLPEFFLAARLKHAEPQFLQAHRWRYARPSGELSGITNFDPDRAVALAGDWTAGARVQGAFLSGMDAAARIASLTTENEYAS